MPLLLSQLTGTGETGTLEWQGQTLEFQYNPNALSYKERKELRKLVAAQAEESPDDPEKDWLIVYITRMVQSWDLYATKKDAEQKKALPITAATLDGLPAPFLLAIVTRLGELVNPPATPSSDSGGSFSAVGGTNGASATPGI